MKNLGSGFGEIQIRAVPKGVSPTMVKKRPPAAVHFRHHVGVGSGSASRDTQKAGVNVMFLAIVENELAEGVLAHQARGEKGKRGTEFGEINQNVVRRAAAALRLAANVGELLRLRIDINHFDLINDPVATGK